MSRFRHHKYIWKRPFGTVSHSWDVVSLCGAISFHVSFYKPHEATCGLEFHSAQPVGDRAPDHINCPLTGGRCWHDGTSMYAEEYVWPQVKPFLAAGEHDEIFRILENEHDKHFERNGAVP